MLNESKAVALRRRNLVIMEKDPFMNVPDDVYKENSRYVNAIDANIRTLGYCMSEELYDKLCNSDLDEIIAIGENLQKQLNELKGADLDYEPLYPNFPKEVLTKEENELYFNAIVHYFKRDLHKLGFEMEEKSPEKEYRLPMPKDNIKLQTLNAGNKSDVLDIIKDMMKSNISFSKQDKEDIEELISENSEWKQCVPDKLENKENLATICGIILQNPKQGISQNIEDMNVLNSQIKSATDVMRIYVALSDGDVSMSEKNKFKAQPRAIRKYLLQQMNKDKNIYTQMSMRPEEFKKMLQYLHVNEFRDSKGKLKYPNVSHSIDKIRDGEKEKSNIYFLTEALKAHNTDKVIEIVTREPGVFARKIDEIIRKTTPESQNNVLEAFTKVAEKIPTKTLLTLREHFAHRKSDKDINIYFPKGDTAKAYISAGNEKLDENICDKISEICTKTLVLRFKDKGNLGKVYIDENLRGYKAPVVMRNVSKEAKVITRGSRLPLDEKKNVLRSFIWWKDDVDIDLSAVVLDDKNKEIKHISYTDLKNHVGVHSGDITYQRENGHEGECEFIDIDLNTVKNAGGKYVAFQVHNYSGYSFSKTECKFGYMERDELMTVEKFNRNQIYPNTGELFEPLTVHNLMNISANAQSVIPFVYDVDKREIVWADIAISGIRCMHNVENTLGAAAVAVKACVDNESPSLYDLLQTHVEARGELITDKSQADEIFSLDEGSTPFETEKIISRFIADGKDEYCYEALKEKESENAKEQENIIDGVDGNKYIILKNEETDKFTVCTYPEKEEVTFSKIAFSDPSLMTQLCHELNRVERNTFHNNNKIETRPKEHIKRDYDEER